MATRLFTSESVTEGHPDKVCDCISDAVLDAIFAQDANARVACECAASTNLLLVMGEVTTTAHVDITAIARDVVDQIGYNKPEYGFDANSLTIITALNKQSPDIALGVDRALEQKSGENEALFSTGAGDQGMMFGYSAQVPSVDDPVINNGNQGNKN